MLLDDDYVLVIWAIPYKYECARLTFHIIYKKTSTFPLKLKEKEKAFKQNSFLAINISCYRAHYRTNNKLKEEAPQEKNPQNYPSRLDQ